MNNQDFNHALSEMSNVLKPFALKLTKDTDEANDLLQETLLKAFTHSDKFAEGTNLKAWLYTIMRNTFITNYQRTVRRNTFIDTTDNLHYINSVESITLNLAYSSFAMSDIDKALNTIEDTYSQPFIMYFRGFKYNEIAEKLKIPIGTVKNRIHIARQELKKKLTPYRN